MPGCKCCSRRGIASRLSECRLCSTWRLWSLDAKQAISKAVGSWHGYCSKAHRYTQTDSKRLKTRTCLCRGGALPDASQEEHIGKELDQYPLPALPQTCLATISTKLDR